MSRTTERLSELMPEMFCEVGPELAEEVGLTNGGWGTRGIVKGDSANDLLGLVLDPNVYIGEYKASTCDIKPGRRPRGPALTALVENYRCRAGANNGGART